MCELFAYSSRVPARVRFAFREFARHGGPHAANTGDLVSFKIQKEESSSAGVRRIKATIGRPMNP